MRNPVFPVLAALVLACSQEPASSVAANGRPMFWLDRSVEADTGHVWQVVAVIDPGVES